MKNLNEWMQSKGINENYGMHTVIDEDLVASQVDMIVTKLEGIIHDLDANQKSAVMDRFMKQVEERILGI
jgi:hypothetical protein